MSSETDFQSLRKLVISMTLGDGYIAPKEEHHNTCLEMDHSIDQLEYLLWKIELLNKSGMNTGKLYFSKRREVRVRTQRHTIFNIVRELLYKDGIKILSKNILRNLNVLGLAIWYCDDGSACIVKPKWRKQIYKIEGRPSHKVSQFRLATQGFSEKDAQNAIYMLNELFGLPWQYNLNKDGQPGLFLNGIESMDTFKSMLLPIIPDCMKYKLDHPTSFLYDSPEETERENVEEIQ